MSIKANTSQDAPVPSMDKTKEKKDSQAAADQEKPEIKPT
jgi:hypothetical protein